MAPCRVVLAARRSRPARADRALPQGRDASGGKEVAIDAILTVVAAASPSVGRTRTVEILRGGRSKVVLKNGYDELPGYGEFDGWRSEELLARSTR